MRKPGAPSEESPFSGATTIPSVIQMILLRVLCLTLVLARIAVSQDSVECTSLHFQFTAIQQMHPSFHARYSGTNSLVSSGESRLSVTSTLYLARRLWSGAEGFFDAELQGGSGFSLTHGIAGFPNGEVYRVDDPAPKVALARLFMRQTFPISDERVWRDADQHQLAGLVPMSRAVITLGRFSLTDIFDQNSFAHDPRTQFMNWSMWAGGAWDYAADTRGYDWGIASELILPSTTVNFAAVMEPAEANGPFFDHDLSRAYSLNAEACVSYALGAQKGKLHLVTFFNHAKMGNYRAALNQAAGSDAAPVIEETRAYCSKTGMVLSLEQSLTHDVGAFARYSWNDGRTETWAFTEIDRSFQAGVNVSGGAWNRSTDALGIGVAVNALSKDHREYLAAGGYGFLIGDGALHYGWETIVEAYYALALNSSVQLSLDIQTVINPAYNIDRGPLVGVFALRVHVEV